MTKHKAVTRTQGTKTMFHRTVKHKTKLTKQKAQQSQRKPNQKKQKDRNTKKKVPEPKPVKNTQNSQANKKHSLPALIRVELSTHHPT